MPNIFRNFDSRLEHRALGSAAMTSTTTLVTKAERVAQRTRYVTKAIIEAIDIASNDEVYTLVAEVSNDAFSTKEVAGILSFGPTETRVGGAPDNVAGDEYDLHWSTEVNGVVYKDWRLRLIVGGTTPTITLGCWSGVEEGI